MNCTRFGALATAAAMLESAFIGRADAQNMQVSPTNDSRTSLERQQVFAVTPKRIYDALLDSATFAAFTRAPATIDPSAGGAFSLFGGLIVGRNIELVPFARIVQAWRSETAWEPGVYSIVEFQITSGGGGAVLAIRQTGFPQGMYEHLYAGWQAHYLDRLAAYFEQSH